MASGLRIGSVKHSPAAVGGYGFPGRASSLHGAKICRFGSKRPATVSPLRASSPLSCSAPSSTVATAKQTLPPPSPPSDLTSSPVPLLLVPKILLDKDKYQLGENEEDPFVFYSLPNKEIMAVEKNRKSWRRDQIRDAHWIGSSKGWIMYMNRPYCNLYLCNPFSPSASSIIPLPPIETLPCVSGRHFRRRSLSSKEMDIEFVLNDWYNAKDPLCVYYEGPSEDAVACEAEKTKKKWFEVPPPFDPPETVPSEDLIKRGFISKMVLNCTPPSPSTNVNYSDCLVAILYGYSRKLAICRLGDNSWTRLDGLSYNDITFSKHDKLCLYTWDKDHIKSWQLSNPKSPECKVITRSDIELIPTCLVESATEPGNVLMVGSSLHNDAMEVHKVDTAKKSCLQVDCLEDQALFVGDFSEAMSVPATQLPVQLKPNCIYFSNFKCFQLGVFNLKERVVNYHAFDDGLSLDLSGREEFDETEREYWVWMEQFRKGEGWAIWVVPNPW